MELGWFPLKQLLRWTARRHGFIDPVTLIARLSGFGQPAEIEQPIELLRAGVILHARGLINARVIQHNLDWVWPWWVERQFDPRDPSFIPRAFSITHVNLTHRNWTALGLPDEDVYPLVDPRGLLTPHRDGWSLDTWIIGDSAHTLIPSRDGECQQAWAAEHELQVRTEITRAEMAIRTDARLLATRDGLEVVLDIEARVPHGSFLVVSVRPYNPEGVSFIDALQVGDRGVRWCVNGTDSFAFDRPPLGVVVSRYAAGDVFRHLEAIIEQKSCFPREMGEENPFRCPVGLASGAAVFAGGNGATPLQVTIPVGESSQRRASPLGGHRTRRTWSQALAGGAIVSLGDARLDQITQAAARTLHLLSPGDIYPGPFTYRRFWFRDAGFMINGLLAAGLVDPVVRCIDRFEQRQDSDGYLRSQEGEWDSNGIALWAIDRLCATTNRRPYDRWIPMVRRAATWISKKRRTTLGQGRHSGLLPAGFSAEHFGPNDFYFWDDFWGIAGLDAAAAILERVGHPALAADYRADSRAFRLDLYRVLGGTCRELGFRAIPASPYRRLDAGAIGSIVCGYPLHLLPIDDPALRATVEYLLANCCVNDAFFQDMIHSGINPYLSLQLAQVLRRMNDVRAHRIFERVGSLASSTGQWPEAIHPMTGGGCMGDGQHGWAAAEWVAYTRSMFVAEEGSTLMLCSGLPLMQLPEGVPVRAERIRTDFGVVSVEVVRRGVEGEVRWSCEWYGDAPRLVVRFLSASSVDIEGRSGILRYTQENRAALPRRVVG